MTEMNGETPLNDKAAKSNREPTSSSKKVPHHLLSPFAEILSWIF